MGLHKILNRHTKLINIYVTVNPQNQEIINIRVCEVKYRIECFIELKQKQKEDGQINFLG